MRWIVAAFVGCALPLTASLLLTNANPRDNAAPSAAAIAQPVESGDPDRGKTVFEKRCTGCHALDQDREGPRLGGVYGRASGAIAGFPYSPALAKAHIVWNEATLEQWLTDPESLVPGNNMDFHIPRPQERRDVIEFLKQRVNK